MKSAAITSKEQRTYCVFRPVRPSNTPFCLTHYFAYGYIDGNKSSRMSKTDVATDFRENFGLKSFSRIEPKLAHIRDFEWFLKTLTLILA